MTLQVLAEGFSAAGVPVFLSDIKGDLAGLSMPGSAQDKRHDAFVKRSATIGLDLHYRAFPVIFWDLFGEQGHPIRTTVADMGPLLLSRLLELTEPQEGVLNIAFRMSDEEGLPLLDLKDLQSLLVFIGENAGRHRPALWQRRARHRRRHPAPPAGAGEPGRRAACSANRRSILPT